jgi:hypothetical protein
MKEELERAIKSFFLNLSFLGRVKKPFPLIVFIWLSLKIGYKEMTTSTLARFYR